eukprot:2914038-Amphidinium_carterae.1
MGKLLKAANCSQAILFRCVCDSLFCKSISVAFEEKIRVHNLVPCVFPCVVKVLKASTRYALRALKTISCGDKATWNKDLKKVELFDKSKYDLEVETSG